MNKRKLRTQRQTALVMSLMAAWPTSLYTLRFVNFVVPYQYIQWGCLIALEAFGWYVIFGICFSLYNSKKR